MKLTNSARLVDQQVAGILFTLAPQCRHYRCAPLHTALFRWILEATIPVLMLVEQTLNQLAKPPGLSIESHQNGGLYHVC